MKQIVPGIIGAVLFVAAQGLVAGVWATDAPLPVKLSLIASKDRYAVGEKIEFEIRIDNIGSEMLSVPAGMSCGGGYVSLTTFDTSGEKLEYTCETLDEFFGDAEDVVNLKPGSFYGVSDWHQAFGTPGTCSFQITFYGPRSEEFPRLWQGTVSSEKLEIPIVQ